MVSTSHKAVQRLREQLIRKCFEAGIGFRILVTAGKSGEATFGIKLDKQHQGDEVIELDGVKIFLDPASAAQIRDYQLDYHDEPNGGFYLNTMQKAKDRRD